jgi:peroxiredoxin
LSVLRQLLLLIILGAAIESSAQQKAPDLSLKDINGKSVRLSDFKGKVVLLNFWATWCVPCRAEIPDLVKMQRRYRTCGLRIIGITYPPDETSEVRSFVRELKMNYPVVIGSKETKQAFTASETLPLTVVIDRQGTVREIIEGIMYADEFDRKVKPLLTLRLRSRTHTKRVSIRMSNVTLMDAPWHVGRRPRSNDAQLQRELVHRIDFGG